MRQITERIKPTSGFAHFVHIALTILLPVLIFVFVRIRFFHLAAALILLSKWRMFAVKPRHWPANVRANGVDLIVGLSILVFMVHTGSQLIQLFWAVMYGVWLLALKPQSSILGVAFQAILAQSLGLVALFLGWGEKPAIILVGFAWLICYLSARHFFANFEESLTRFLSYLWGYFAAAMTWVLSHWLLFYGPVAQPALLLSVIGFGLGGMYYLSKTDGGSVVLRRQLIFVMAAVITIVLLLSDWGDKTI